MGRRFTTLNLSRDLLSGVTWYGRIKKLNETYLVMEDPVLTSNKYERGTIDTRDTSTSRLHQIIDQGPTNNDEKQLFLTYSSLLEGGEKLHHCHQASKTTMLSTATKYYDKIHLLESNLKTCEETIYKGSSTTSGHPVLSPPHVQESIKQLEDLLQKLEASIVEKLREINNKKAALQKDNLLMREKTLFVDFLINPGRIQQALEKLSNRLHAMSVQ
ncbi:hypothetical protein LOTGIDRAFT_228044 [Lottia gigantea]|uniref:Uncharacterized protein n=1 Tax=Lottia gigantea TaxID=225164 RepID=V4B4Q9_LOTGI|nr:hypothetical protein LOTGIDRAFT_228044 [Lottia gigantea]ESP05468.1 hypothetical protein LOTGIDRAFT_228044 [Lottia gigantea]